MPPKRTFQSAVRTETARVTRQRTATNKDLLLSTGVISETRREITTKARATRARASKIQLSEVVHDDIVFKDEEDDDYHEGTAGTDAHASEEPARVVNSTFLPLPWTGRLGYACINTYLRAIKPPVFSSRTCRIASILEHRHPLQDPTQPQHPTKNRPNKKVPADIALGQEYVRRIGLANAGDMLTVLRWNERYGIRFMRLSSDMFPFASHHEHGYRLAPFAAGILAKVGALAGQLGHRLTMHPGQYTQLGSPRAEVVDAAIRDLEYHDELLTLLHLPPQLDRDAIMILHMGGVFGDKAATLARFRNVYRTRLSPSVRARLVLENDDVSWSVHDLLPVCEELDIPLVLDFHHHNIVFDASQVRQGTADVDAATPLAARIRATWTRKMITQKMHYSEPCAGAITPRDRRKHSARVATLPPCPPDMDLMIEAKDKEQAVFSLMRQFQLPGHERVKDMIPMETDNDNEETAVTTSQKKTKTKRRKVAKKENSTIHTQIDTQESEEGLAVKVLSREDVIMGGPEGRVFWSEGTEPGRKRK